MINDDLGLEYLNEQERKLREERDRWRAAQAGTPSQAFTAPEEPAPRPVQTLPQPAAPGGGTGAGGVQPEQIGVVREAARGVARGTFGLAGAVGTGLHAAGIVLNSDTLRQTGELVAKHWADAAQGYAPSAEAQGNLWDNPGKILNPNWLAANIAETVPALAATFIPAVGVGGVLMRVGGSLVPWTAMSATALARIGAQVTGGSIGGFLAGSGTFEKVKARGGSDEDALQAMAVMGLAAAGLQSIQLGAFMRPGASVVVNGTKVGAWGALGSWLNHPTEALIIGDDVWQAMKEGLNSIPGAFVGGAALGAVHGRPAETPGAKLKGARAAFDQAVQEANAKGQPIPPEVVQQATAAFETAAQAAPEPSAAPPGAETTGKGPIVAPGAPATLTMDNYAPAPPVSRGTPGEPVQGSTTQIRVPAAREPYAARYELVEAGSLITSHDPQSFAINPAFPEGVQNRPYHSDVSEQAKVIRQAQDFEPLFLLSPTPSSGGTPIVAPGSNVVLSGNSRSMTLLRRLGSPDFEHYKAELARLAPVYGLTAEQVKGMQNPVLVRRLEGGMETPAAMRAFARQTNEGFKQALNQEAAAVSQGQAMSPETLKWIASGIESAGEGATLNEFLTSGKDRELIRRLVKDGVVTEREINRYVDQQSGRLNDDGRKLVSRAILGSAVPDSDVLKLAPDAALQKVSRSLAPLAQARAAGGAWDLSGDLTQALRTLTDLKARGMTTTAELRAQTSLIPEATASARADALADALTKMKPTEFQKALEHYAEDASGQQRLGEAPRTPGQAFEAAFGVAVGEPSAAAISSAGTPSARSLSGEAGKPEAMTSATVPPGSQPLSGPAQSSERTMPASVSASRPSSPPSETGAEGYRRVGAIDPLSSKMILQPSADVDNLLKLAREAQPAAEIDLRAVADQVPGATFTSSRVKPEESARLKMVRKGERDPSTFSDYLGARMSLERIADGDLVRQGLEARGLRVVEDENLFDTARADGYRARHLQIELPNGLTMELQLMPKELAAVQELAHGFYEVLRHPEVTPEAAQAAADGSRALYEKAWAAYQARVGEARSVPSEPVGAAGAGAGLPPGAPRAPPGAAPAGGWPPEIRLNTGHLDASESVKATAAAVNLALSQRLGADRAVKSHAETIAGAEALHLTVEEALSWELGKPLTEEQSTALRDLTLASDANLDSLIGKAAAGDREAGWSMFAALTITAELEARRETTLRRAARTLNAAAIDAEGERASAFNLKDLADLAETMRGQVDVDPQVLAARLQLLRTEAQRAGFARQVSDGAKRGESVFYEAWINGLLSGPQTHVVNFLSNMLTSVWAVPERALAANLHFGGPPGVVRGEATAMLRGVVEGAIDSLRFLAGRSVDVKTAPLAAAWEAFRTGKDPTAGSKLEVREPAFTAGAFGADSGASIGRALDFIGHAIRMPGQLLVTGDAFFKAMNYRMELKAQAYREASHQNLTGTDFAREVARLEADPPSGIKRAADNFALLQTFQNELGPGGQAVMAWRDAVPGARVILPFLKTPTNIMLWVGQRTPVLNALSAQLRSDLVAGGARRDLALGKISSGALFSAGIAMLAAAKNITGGGPSDPDLKRELRDSGWQPYSIKVGDTYYAYNRLDPIGALLGVIADTTEILGHVEEFHGYELALAAGLSLSRNMVSKTYLEGLANVLEAIHSPDRSWHKLAKSWARTIVPTGVRSLQRALDPTVKETQSLLDEIKAGVPGWSDSLPPKRNLFGEPVQLPPSLGPRMISPIYASSEKQDPVKDEIARLAQVPGLEMRLNLPSKVIYGVKPPWAAMREENLKEGVELTPAEYDQYTRWAGNELKDPGTGLGMRDALDKLISSAQYERATDGARAMGITHIVHGYREAARRKLIVDSAGLKEAVVEKLTTRAQALTPTVIQSIGR